MNLGYDKNLFILPFDHRQSFVKELLGKEEINEEDKLFIKGQKRIIYEAFQKAVKIAVPKTEAAILVDEEYGEEILKDANEKGFITLLAVEKSGDQFFNFEYGENFGEHVLKINPIFVKTLIHYTKEEFDNDKEKLKKLSDFCRQNNLKFIVEPLVSRELDVSEKRKQLTIEVIEAFQNFGIEPDVWKIEGMEREGEYLEIIEIAKKEGRDNVGVVILGAGEEKEEVEKKLLAGVGVKGILGFAIGRTVFLEPLKNLKENTISKEQAIDQIAQNFTYFYNLFITNRQ